MTKLICIAPYRDYLVGLDTEGNVYRVVIDHSGQPTITLLTQNPL